MEPEIARLQFYRLSAEGELVPWIFEVERQTKVIVAEYRRNDRVPTDPAIATPAIAEFAGPAQQVQTAARILGAVTRPLPGGGTEILSISTRGQAMLHFLNDNGPCPPWFVDCERLRQRYRHDLAQLPKDEAGKCADCESGEIIRAYLEKLDTIFPR